MSEISMEVCGLLRHLSYKKCQFHKPTDSLLLDDKKKA